MIKGKVSSETKMWRKVISFVLILWGLNVVAFALFSHKDYGNFGDSFGAVNSLFSGLALASIVISIFLQRRDLKLQRQDLVMQREELQLQRKELEETRKVFETQSKIMTDQQNDNTFFNLLSNHRQLVESFKKGELRLGGGKKFDEKYLNSHTDIVSGYEVLSQIANKWKDYFGIYSESYREKVILDINLHEYPSYKKLIDSDPVTHVFYRELLHVHKFIDTRFDEQSAVFYRDTLFKSLTEDEKFIFEAIYYNYMSLRDGVFHYPDYYLRHFFEEFETSILPSIHVFQSGNRRDYLRFTIKQNAKLQEAAFVIYEWKEEPEGVIVVIDIIPLVIDDLQSFIGMEVSLLDCIYKSNLGIKEHPFPGKDKIRNKQFALVCKLETKKDKFTFMCHISVSVHDRMRENNEIYYDLSSLQIVAMKKQTYSEIKRAIDDFNLNRNFIN